MIRTMVRSITLAVAATFVAAAGLSEVQPGDQSRWTLDFRARLEQASSPAIEVHMTGDWTETISAIRNGEYDAQLQLANVQFNGDAVSNAPASSVAKLRARLCRPVWATYRNDGELLSMHFMRDESPTDRNLLQMIATELQIVRPAAAQTSWTTQERDGAGQYSALYHMEAPSRIVKRKLKYDQVDGVSGVPANSVHVSIEHSEVTIQLAANGAAKAIDGNDRIAMNLSPTATEKLSAVTEFHASNLRSGRAPELIGSLERQQSNVAGSPIVTQRPEAGVVRAEADDRLLHGYTTEAVLDAGFAKNAGAAENDRLTALFRQRPEAAAAAAAMLTKNGPIRSVTNALGAAGSLSAVVALDGLAHNAALPGNLRVDALVAFVQMQHPTAEAMHVPSDLARDSESDIRSAARMIDGALAHAGRAQHPAEADAIDAELIGLYRSAEQTQEKIEMLGALGNSAGPSVVPVLEDALRDSTASIRAAAARGLRLATGFQVDHVLGDTISSDRDAAVRADAIFATRFRHPLSPPLVEALLHAASDDAARYVRSDAIAVLHQNSGASSQVAETLGRIAQLDADAGIRRQAREALGNSATTATTQR